MADYYVNSIYGKDTNSGSVLAPFKTLSKAVSLINNNTHIYILNCTVSGGNYTLPNKTGVKIIGIGNATIDCAGDTRAFYIYRPSGGYFLENLNITGFSSYFLYQGNSIANSLTLRNCCIYNTGSLKDQAYILYNGSSYWLYAGYFRWWGCTIWGVMMEDHPSGQSGNKSFYMYECLINTTNSNLPGVNCYRCASNISAYQSNDGFSTVTFPTPFISEDPSTPDLRFDPNHAQFSKYAQGGAYNLCVGNSGRPGVMWRYSHSFNGSFGNSTYPGAWQNDDSYYDPSWQDIVIDSTSNKIDFNEGGSEITSTLTDGTYTSGANLATEVQTQLNTDGSSTYTVTFTSGQLINIASDGTALNLLWNSGTNAANTAGDLLNFDTASDSTGLTSYSSTSPLNVGGTAGATSVSIVDDIGMDLTINPDATTARAISPVIDMNVPTTLLRSYVGYDSTGNGGVGDDSTSGSISVRASNEPFAADAASVPSGLDWVTMETEGRETLSHKYRYWQARMTLRLDSSA
jgi:hypothetical protein